MKDIIEIIKDVLAKKDVYAFFITLFVLLGVWLHMFPLGLAGTVILLGVFVVSCVLISIRLVSDYVLPVRYISSKNRNFSVAHSLIKHIENRSNEDPVTIRATLLYPKVDQGEARKQFASELYRLCDNGSVNLLHVMTVENAEKAEFIKGNIERFKKSPHYQLSVIPVNETRRRYFPYISLFIVGDKYALMGLQNSVCDVGPALLFRRKAAVLALCSYFDHLMKWAVEIKDREQIYWENYEHIVKEIRGNALGS